MWDLAQRKIIAVLTGTVCRASKRSLIVRCAVSGQVPCSGAKRRDKVLDVVSTAIHGGAAAVNKLLSGRIRPDNNSNSSVIYKEQ